MYPWVLDGMTQVATQINKTVGSTAKGLSDLSFTTNEIKQARAAVITVEGDEIRWRTDTAPTAANGHIVPENGTFYVLGKKVLKTLKLIRVTTDATVTISLYK